MRILSNPDKESINRRKHGRTFERVGELFASPVLEPVEVGPFELAARPISLRDATRGEERDYWSLFR